MRQTAHIMTKHMVKVIAAMDTVMKAATIKYKKVVKELEALMSQLLLRKLKPTRHQSVVGMYIAGY